MLFMRQCRSSVRQPDGTNMRLLDRYVCRQLVLPFLIGVTTFAVIMLGDVARQLGSILFGLRAPLPLIMGYLLYHAPHAVVWSMPVGIVVAVAMTLTSLMNHGEIRAMRVGGASILRICAPLLVVGLLTSAVALLLNEYVVPPAGRKATELFARMTHSQPIVREQYDVYFRDDQRRLFYVGHMDAANNRLERVAIWTEDDAGNLATMVTADWAELSGNRWLLREGQEMVMRPDGDIERVEKFGSQAIMLGKALQDYYTGQRRELEMSGAQLRDLIGTLSTGGGDTQKLAVRLQFKYSIPLACLVFALLAAPIAIRFADYGTFVGVVIAILVVFLYNGVRSWTLAFGLAGMLHPVVAGWTQNVLFGVLGLILLLRTR
jgi:lipopolysaccharide export system permease protein